MAAAVVVEAGPLKPCEKIASGVAKGGTRFSYRGRAAARSAVKLAAPLLGRPAADPATPAAERAVCGCCEQPLHAFSLAGASVRAAPLWPRC